MPDWSEWCSQQVTCPHCGESWEDLWDYDWDGAETIEEDCPHCENPILLGRAISVEYASAKPD